MPPRMMMVVAWVSVLLGRSQPEQISFAKRLTYIGQRRLIQVPVLNESLDVP